MLIHGDIIAREHGLPSVTIVAEAARLTVDEYLDIVVLQREANP